MPDQSDLRASLAILRDSLAPIVEKLLEDFYGESWLERINAIRSSVKLKPILSASQRPKWNPDILLNTIVHGQPWTAAFAPFLLNRQRNPDIVQLFIREALQYRNSWAHLDDEDLDPVRFYDDLLRIQRAFGCAEEHQEKIRQMMLNAGYKRTHAIEEVAEKYRSLGPFFVQFWHIVHAAYGRCIKGHPDAPKSLDVLIENTPFPAELPLPQPADVSDWAKRATILQRNLLWDFVSSIYPPRQDDGTEPTSMLTDDEWDAFHMPCRRHIANTLQTVGLMLDQSKIPAYAIPHLLNQEKVVKLSTYLSVALTLRTTNKGPDKPGLFKLYKLIQLARVQDPMSG